MQRCFDLARLGIGRVSPNPAVGAVLVHDGRIIGEGYHPAYGQHHAEVAAVNSVRPADRPLIPASTLYVSLEPCNIYGNTPPCTELILARRIPKVVIAYRDFTPGVDGAGIARLRAAGVVVEEGVLSEEGFLLSLPRNTFVTYQRPYILLKYARTADGFFARRDGQPLWITNPFSRRLVHKWRTETDAVLVGSRTARLDDPALTTRYYPGRHPIRLVIDRRGDLPHHLQLFDGQAPTWVFGPANDKEEAGDLQSTTRFFNLGTNNDDWPRQLLHLLYQQRISHLTIEGGVFLLQAFIERNLWDEARVFTGRVFLGRPGLPAPTLPYPPTASYRLDDDRLDVFHNVSTLSELRNR